MDRALTAALKIDKEIVSYGCDFSITPISRCTTGLQKNNTFK